MKKLEGSITAIATPFTKSGEIDFRCLQSFVRFQLNSGVDGIVACGSTGEAATMNDNEYEKVVRTVVAEVNGKIPVIASAGSNNTAKAVSLSKLAKQEGADMLLHVVPFYNKPTKSGILAHYQAIANEVNLPILIYNVPSRTGLNISAELTLTIAKHIPQVVGIKEASGNITQMMEIIKQKPSYFSVLCGDDSLTLPLISVGGDGCISVVSNEVPVDFTKLVHFGLNGDFVRAKKMHYQLLDLMEVNFIETNPIPVKTALAMMGIMEEVFRLPLLQMEKKNKMILHTILKQYGLVKRKPSTTSQENSLTSIKAI